MNAAGNTVAGRLKFQINPRKRRDGFTLNSALLAFPIWYQTLNEAISYARFIGRDHHCEIRVNDSKGNAIDEINIAEGQNRLLDDVRLTRFSRFRSVPGRRSKKIPWTCQYIALETA